MIRPIGVFTCTEEAYGVKMTLRCEADECHQVFYGGNCIMICFERVNPDSSPVVSLEKGEKREG